MAKHTAIEQYNSISSRWSSLEDIPSERVSNSLLESKLSELPRNLRVLDLGGGTGTYARMAVKLEVAKEVTVVDISSDMLKVGAVEEERTRPGMPKIVFHCADCAEPLDKLGLEPESFDLVMANYFFPYATTRKQLVSMWRNVATYLKSGGKFIGLLPRADLSAHLSRDPWAGITYKYLGQEEESSKSQITFHCTPEVQVDQFMLRAQDYLDAPREVGMTNLVFYPPTAAHIPPSIGTNDRERYLTYLTNPVSDVCMASKAL